MAKKGSKGASAPVKTQPVDQEAELPRSSVDLPKLLLSENYAEDPESRGFAERLKHARQARDLTLEALSLVTKAVDQSGQGVSRVSLSRYESGAEPGIRELRLLSLALRRSLAWLIYGQSEDPMLGELRPPLEEIITELVYEALEAQKLVPPSTPSPRNSPEYTSLLEQARKAAKK